MNKLLFLLISTNLLVTNCGESTSKSEPLKEAPSIETPTRTDESAIASRNDLAQNTINDAQRVLLGTWVGEMSGKKLSIVIEKVGDGSLNGFNTLGTTRRDVTGTFTDGSWDIPCAKSFEAILNEPGDDKYDGVFSIKFVGYEDVEELDGGPECKGNLKGVEAVGTWTSNATKKTKEITLTKQ